MSQPVLNVIILSVLAALYLPVIYSALRRHEGYETAAALLCGYAGVAILLNVGEALRFGGGWQIEAQTANDIQIYGTLLLAVLMTLVTLAFTRKDIWTWLGVGVVWGLLVGAFVVNVFGFGHVVWTNGTASL